MVEIKNPLIVVQSGGGGGDDWGTVTYLDDNDEEQTVTIQSEEEALSQLGKQATTYDIVINNVTIPNTKVTKVNLGSSVTTLGNYAFYAMSNMTELTAPNLVSVGQYFAAWLTSLVTLDLPKLATVGQRVFQNSEFSIDINLPSLRIIDTYGFSGIKFNEPGHSIVTPKLMYIGGTVLNTYSSTNSPFTWEMSDCLIEIGNNFLGNCTGINNDILLPSTLTFVGQKFMTECKNFTSTIICECPASVLNIASGINNVLATTDSTQPLYATGFKFGGTYKSDWKSLLPDRSSSPFRKSTLAS